MLDFDKTWKYLSDVIFNEKCGDGKEIGIDIDFEAFDSVDNKSGEFFTINMFGSKYELGYSHTESESNEYQWCQMDDKHIKCIDLLEKVKNFQQLNREYKLGRLLD